MWYFRAFSGNHSISSRLESTRPKVIPRKLSIRARSKTSFRRVGVYTDRRPVSVPRVVCAAALTPRCMLVNFFTIHINESSYNSTILNWQVFYSFFAFLGSEGLSDTQPANKRVGDKRKPGVVCSYSPASATPSSSYNEHKPKTPPPDLPSLLLDSRIVYIGMPVCPTQYLLWLSSEEMKLFSTINLFTNGEAPSWRHSWFQRWPSSSYPSFSTCSTRTLLVHATYT